MKHLYFSFRTYACCCLMQFAIAFPGYAQESDTQIQLHTIFDNGFFKPQSPEVWSMIKYGKASVDHYSGNLGLSIPVYTYSDSNFNIPVSIDYASNGFKPGMDCGVVGMGWYLNAGGAITREVRGIPDDSFKQEFDWKWKHNAHKDTPDEWHGNFVQVDGYASIYFKDPALERMECAYTGAAGQEYMLFWENMQEKGRGYETEPDLFHFNFMGYSGSFILQPNRQVKVFDTSHPAGEFHVEFLWREYEPLTSGSFIITTGDHTKYYFEQRESCQLKNVNYAETNNRTNFSWKLTKIEKLNGATAHFIYNKTKGVSETTAPTLTIDHLTISRDNGITDQYWQGESPLPWKSQTCNVAEESYLDSIVIQNQAYIAFEYSRKLNRIKVCDKDNRLVKSCDCSYRQPDDQLGNAVIFLKTVYISGEGMYTMNYYDETKKFPGPETYATDWYGYYRVGDSYIPDKPDGNIKSLAIDMQNLRTSNFETTQQGMLHTIHYPTGGSSRFTYELNDYSQLFTTAAPVLNTNKTTGGLRIKQIDTFSKDGVQTQCRRFTYKRADGKSSGVLLQKPGAYYTYFVDAPGVQITREIVSTVSNIGFSKNSHIEYLRVLEETRKTPADPVTSLTEYNFHSAGKNNDCPEVFETYSSNDRAVETPIDGWIAFFFDKGSETNENMRVTRTFVAKKLKSKIQYAGDLSRKVQCSDYHYDYYGHDNNPISAPTTFIGQGVNHEYLPKTAFLSKVVSEQYSENSKLIAHNETRYTIDDLGRRKQTTTYDSKGETIVHDVDYHPIVPVYPSRQVVYRNGRIIDATKYDYIALNGETYFLPSAISKAEIAPAAVTDPQSLRYHPEFSYDWYDTAGNPRQVIDKNGQTTCFLWGYGGSQVVARIDNADFNTIQHLLPAEYAQKPFSDGLPADVETALRRLSKSRVTSYIYKPLVGMTEIKDPAGYVSTYEYDENGKLLCIRDHKGNIVKSYRYHIVTENK